MFDPILAASDGQDGCLRQLVGNGPYGTADLEVAWCEDDFLNVFLEDLRANKDAIKNAAMPSANPLAPKWQDGHGWSPVYPTDAPKFGPVVNKLYKSFAVDELNKIRQELRVQGENFLIDCGISKPLIPHRPWLLGKHTYIILCTKHIKNCDLWTQDQCGASRTKEQLKLTSAC